MNITDRIDIELRRNYTPILNDALACIQVLTDDSNELQRLHNTLEGLDLPIDSEALSAALERAQDEYKALHEVLGYHDLPVEYAALYKALKRLREDHTALHERFDALSDRYDKLSDIVDSYAELYKG